MTGVRTGVSSILLVDDEPDLLSGLKRSFTSRLPDCEVFTAGGAVEALAILSQHDVDLVLMDIMMGEMDGIEALDKIQALDLGITVILMTGYGTIEMAVDAIRRGAWDFITKPLDLESLARLVRKGLERSRLLSENRKLREEISGRVSAPDFVGRSPLMKQLYETIRISAKSDYTVLIRGASGTGKELCARAVHQLSPRASGPFVMVNCPAIPEQLLESELFGYRKGAFTGADKDHEGLFFQANHGTICLDEIGDIPVPIQTKLLRVLQEQEIKQLGAPNSQKIDVRIIASTNSDLEAKIKDGRFREDLFYRLEVITLRMPSLCEIREDIGLLAEHFLDKVKLELGTPAKRFSSSAYEKLVQHNWPGNIRELQNVIRRAVLFCPDQVINGDDLQIESSAPEPQRTAFGRGDGIVPYKKAKDSCLEDFTRRYVMTLLDKTGGNISRAAKLSGLTRAALHKILRRLKIDGLVKSRISDGFVKSPRSRLANPEE
ncbi:Acetoacetate metabolism regulatory protein AtoC [Desulfosarcina cetonica]|nr:Acetoacetate metabolism regulatory protein AtoC [Desulfosarcina cetonica]